MKPDVIVIGARVAGAATALLLARNGLNVKVFERAHFPSDTLSSHQVQVPGVACLERWGLLGQLIATGVPATRNLRFDPGPVVLKGRVPDSGPANAMYSPRRTVLDALLVEAAREAGAEVVEGFDITDVDVEDGRVVGVRGSARSPAGRRDEQTHRAPMVIGADGKHSIVAEAVGARTYYESPGQTAACYAYWDGLELTGGEIYSRGRRVVTVWPTHDGLAVTYVAMPVADFAAFRADREAGLWAALDLTPDLGERARYATRVEPVRGTSDLPHRFRAASGPGWALVGDAGLVMDPLTAQGIGHALQDAEHLAAAVSDGLGGSVPMGQAMAAYGERRDRERWPMHKLTADLASFGPQRGWDQIWPAIAADREATARFFGVLAGTESPRGFFGPTNLRRLLGWRGMLKAMAS